MNSAIKKEIQALRSMGYNSCFFVPGDDISRSRFIHFFVRGQLCIDVYSWAREVSGLGNEGDDWDVDSYDKQMLVIPYKQTREGLCRAYRLARLCVQMPAYGGLTEVVHG